MMSEEARYLGAQVAPDLHALAHLTARLNGFSTFSEWFKHILEHNIDPRARALFLTSDAQQIE